MGPLTGSCWMHQSGRVIGPETRCASLPISVSAPPPLSRVHSARARQEKATSVQHATTRTHRSVRTRHGQQSQQQTSTNEAQLWTFYDCATVYLSQQYSFIIIIMATERHQTAAYPHCGISPPVLAENPKIS